MILPTFIIIGAAKAGTSALHRYLNQHPEICLSSKKELDFFLPTEDWNSLDPYETKVRYASNFTSCQHEKAVGEISPTYLYDPDSARMIHSVLPEVKIIAILRNPVDRAYSHFLMDQPGLGVTAADFERLVCTDGAEPRQLRDYWQYYKNFGFYGAQLQRYFRLFPRKSVAVFLYDDYVCNTKIFFQDLFRFIGVDEQFLPDTSVRFHVGGFPNSWYKRYIYRVAMGSSKIKELTKLVLPAASFRSFKARAVAFTSQGEFKKEPLSEMAREKLAQIYATDIRGLQILLGRDLSTWEIRGE